MIRYWIEMKKQTKLKKIIYGSKDDLENNYKPEIPERFAGAFNSNYIEYRI